MPSTPRPQGVPGIWATLGCMKVLMGCVDKRNIPRGREAWALFLTLLFIGSVTLDKLFLFSRRPWASLQRVCPCACVCVHACASLCVCVSKR